MINIRREEEKDYFEVENLIREAFWNVYRPGCYEHFVMHRLRKDPCFVKELDYVMEYDHQIIAQIAYAKGTIECEDGKIIEMLLFGPVSVLPQFQHQGYGERLIRYTMNVAKDLGYPSIVITGNPDYYHKYGFESCSRYHIYYEGMDRNDDAPFFMIKVLDECNIQHLRGIYRDPSCYMVEEKDLEVFDQLFPQKIKEKREGQLG